MERAVASSTASTRRVRRTGRVVDEGMTVARPRVRRTVVDEPVADVVVDEAPRVSREMWSPAQIVSMAVGAALLLLGVVALARAGVGSSSLTATHVDVAGFHHSGLLGLLELFLGLILVGIAAIPGGAKPLMIFVGVLLTTFGIFVAIAASEFHDSLATHAGHGVLYLVAGLILTLSASVSPYFFPGRRQVVRR